MKKNLTQICKWQRKLFQFSRIKISGYSLLLQVSGTLLLERKSLWSSSFWTRACLAWHHSDQTHWLLGPPQPSHPAVDDPKDAVYCPQLREVQCTSPISPFILAGWHCLVCLGGAGAFPLGPQISVAREKLLGLAGFHLETLGTASKIAADFYTHVYTPYSGTHMHTDTPAALFKGYVTPGSPDIKLEVWGPTSLFLLTMEHTVSNSLTPAFQGNSFKVYQADRHGNTKVSSQTLVRRWQHCQMNLGTLGNLLGPKAHNDSTKLPCQLESVELFHVKEKHVYLAQSTVSDLCC